MKDQTIYRDDGSCVKYHCENKYYYNKHGKLHSFNNKPAIIFKNGTKLWYDNGDLIKIYSNEEEKLSPCLECIVKTVCDDKADCSKYMHFIVYIDINLTKK